LVVILAGLKPANDLDAREQHFNVAAHSLSTISPHLRRTSHKGG
jgi:hypothetical protein